MPTVTVSIEITAPVGRVFTAFTDIEHGREHVTNIKDIMLPTPGLFPSAPGLPPGLLSPLEWALSGRVRDALRHDLADLKESVERALQ